MYVHVYNYAEATNMYYIFHTKNFCMVHLTVQFMFFSVYGSVSGMCHGISLGSHTITYAIGYCSGYSHTDAYTGWQSY